MASDTDWAVGSWALPLKTPEGWDPLSPCFLKMVPCPGFFEHNKAIDGIPNPTTYKYMWTEARDGLGERNKMGDARWWLQSDARVQSVTEVSFLAVALVVGISCTNAVLQLVAFLCPHQR